MDHELKSEHLRQSGNSAYSSGAYKEAEAKYSECLQCDDASDTCRCLAFSNRAQVRLKVGNPKGALNDAVAALFIDPRNTKARYRQITALIQLGEAADSTHVCAEALQWTTDPTAKRQLETLLLEAKAAYKRPPHSIPERLETQDVHSAWRALRGEAPLEEWFPPSLREGWEWIPNVFPDRDTENLLLILHGMGDSPGNFGKLARTMGLPGTTCLALAAPLQLPLDSGRTWFKSVNDDWVELPVQEIASSLQSTGRLLQTLIRNLHEKGGWPLSRIHLLGYSQGGTLALHLAILFRGEKVLGSCVSISGAANVVCLEATGHATAGLATPVMITHGDRDLNVSRADIERSLSGLRKAGSDAGLYSVAGKGHAMIGSEAEMRAIMAFWAKHLKAGPPKTAKGGEFVEVQNRV